VAFDDIRRGWEVWNKTDNRSKLSSQQQYQSEENFINFITIEMNDICIHNSDCRNACNAISDSITKTSFDVHITPHPVELTWKMIYHSAYSTLKITLPSEYPGVILNSNGLGFELIIVRQRLRHCFINWTFDHIIANLRTMHRLL
jgi:hypothetical protein